ncbi:MAG: branched-chain amino acid ABC transporter permease [Clostridiales bacterium]|nr:branched-chain amino acid ABC transporter permease [Clostridiales bacterium]
MKQNTIRAGMAAAIPVAIGYVPLGLACGIVGAKAGLSLLQVALLSVFLYAGSGQFMIASMFAAGASPISIGVSVALVNMRHILYGSALVQYFHQESKWFTTLFAAEITDESFGVNIGRFQKGNWNPRSARAVNTTSHATWTLSNCLGVIVGTMIPLDTAIIGFSMTSIFICLLMMQKSTQDHLWAMGVAAFGVVGAKLLGLSQVAILIGALMGVAAGVIAGRKGR